LRNPCASEEASSELDWTNSESTSSPEEFHLMNEDAAAVQINFHEMLDYFIDNKLRLSLVQILECIGQTTVDNSYTCVL
jgi:hypothetical protein